MNDIDFVAASDAVLDAMRAAGVDARQSRPIKGRTFAVGDFIAYPEAPSLAYRVVWRLYAHAAPARAPSWLIGIEPAPHPLTSPP